MRSDPARRPARGSGGCVGEHRCARRPLRGAVRVTPVEQRILYDPANPDGPRRLLEVLHRVDPRTSATTTCRTSSRTGKTAPAYSLVGRGRGRGSRRAGSASRGSRSPAAPGRASAAAHCSSPRATGSPRSPRRAATSHAVVMRGDQTSRGIRTPTADSPTTRFLGGAPAGGRVTVTVAALLVEADGVYANLPGVDCWDEARDARLYDGPYPVVAHPPCQRWCRFAEGDREGSRLQGR
jgi:hypothetical protein